MPPDRADRAGAPPLIRGRRPSIRELATWLDASRAKATTRLAPRDGSMRHPWRGRERRSAARG